jgi:general secretion pathway protein G
MRAMKKSKGFSLVEMVLVLQTITILALIMIPMLWAAFEKSKQRTTMADMKTIATALATYKIDSNYYPNVSDVTQLASVLMPNYVLDLKVKDAWNHNLDYTANLENYTIESFGRDGANGMNITYHTRDVYDLDIVLTNGRFANSPVE